MPKIAILPDLLINKIAAGEVVERPASVVRELLDNAIDAGATRIDVEILHGGKKLIKVTDNGSGMDRDDAVMSLERHATSKIETDDQLFNISTLGFRGEALPAISSVSKLTLMTAIADAETGLKIEIGAKRDKVISEIPPLKGTTIEIRDIFYNTPARRKFLKTIPTELSHIINTIVQKAFAYTGIAFTLSHNNSEVMGFKAAADLKERFVQLYGAGMADEFLSINKESKAMRVYGFVSSPGGARASRSHQLIFVNLRPVKNATINHAIYNAYRDEIPNGKHPAYFLFLDVDPMNVDVNVHPAKLEVKFERPDDIHRFVRGGVYEALNPGTEVDATPLSWSVWPGRSGGKYGPVRTVTPAVSEASETFGTSQTDFFSAGITPEVRSFFHIGESFIATVTDKGLLIIDQHAAHERIFYEKFLKQEKIESEELFMPVRIELPPREYNFIIKQREALKGLGLEIEEFGKNNLIVRSMPQELHKTDVRGLLIDVAEGIIEEETTGIRSDAAGEALLKNIAARLACHRSVRGSEQLNNEEMTAMMSDLKKTAEPDKCPHGRPTTMLFSINDLQKMFKRK
ncbi:MAG: DNA mismatch repair endonuclease MutL [Nitrospira sp.]|nr:DNA mismatch repair endonuclease MutL [Nitrospira sp.]